MREKGCASMSTNQGDITHLLAQWRNGDKIAEASLFELLMPDLHRIAASCFAKERPEHTLQATALVNEAFVKLQAAKRIDFQDRGHFLALAARVMRRYLIDYWRTKPPVRFEQLDALPDGLFASYTDPFDKIAALDAALDKLEAASKQWRDVVELKYFLGLKDEDAAQALNLKLHTYQRESHRARQWLFDHLTEKPC
jgi:RNA polymerase sigma factor (TIGR02999 family)